jgi:hypothetical protein
VVSREISPLDSAVVTIGSIHGGTAFNVIPNSVQLHGTARSFTEITGRALPQKIRRIVEGTAAACGVRATIRYERSNGATVNDPRMADILTTGAGSQARGVWSPTRTAPVRMSVRTSTACPAASSSWKRAGGPATPTPLAQFDLDERRWRSGPSSSAPARAMAEGWETPLVELLRVGAVPLLWFRS